jgi:hypothetical protein
MGSQRDCRPLCQEEHPDWIDDGTLCRAPSPLPGPVGDSRIRPHAVNYLTDEDVSYELKDAPRMCVPTSLSEISLAQMRVLAWLQQHKPEIVEAEKRFHVDRRAIAGAIAWEATMNVRGAFAGTFGRFVGAAKAHVVVSSFGLTSANLNTLVKQVEDATWLPPAERIPKQTLEGRVLLLQKPDGAITYLGAAMNAASYVAEKAGFPSIRKRSEVLTFFWQKKDLKTWDELLKKKPKGTDFLTGPDPKKDMDRWVVENMGYLEDGVGQPGF